MVLNKIEGGLAGVYVHVPYCDRKCIYCDFYSVGGRLANWRAYTDAVISEFRAREREIFGAEAVTLYIGGGTPSLMPPEEIRRIRDSITLPVTEFTIEVNPDDVTDELSSAWRAIGVNRVSMGVQSLNDSELKMIGRRHDSAKALSAYAILRKYFSNISLDLMFGLPGQDLTSLRETLVGFIALRPEHISAYSLMYEERTALTRMRDAGNLKEVAEEDSVSMFRLINEELRGGGYERYEISNYSLPGYRSVHNSNYWQGKRYLGLGPSAHSYDGVRCRRWNSADVKGYISHYTTEELSSVPFYEEEILSDEELREEMIMTRLRRAEGLNLDEYEAAFGVSARRSLERKASGFIEAGELLLKENKLSLSEAGVMISDEIIVSLF